MINQIEFIKKCNEYKWELNSNNALKVTTTKFLKHSSTVSIFKQFEFCVSFS